MRINVSAAVRRVADALEAAACVGDRIFAAMGSVLSFMLGVFELLAPIALTFAALGAAAYLFFPRGMLSPDANTLYPVVPDQCTRSADSLVTCKAVAEDPIALKLDRSGRQVIFRTGERVGRWDDCTIFDKANWHCLKPVVSMADGRADFWNHGQVFVPGYQWRLWHLGFKIEFQPDCDSRAEGHLCR